jgi:hypothetical protein
VYETPDASKRVTLKNMILDVLGKDYESLSLLGMSINEDAQNQESSINYEIKHNDDVIAVKEAVGQGATDAFFKSISHHFKHLSSIETMQLKSFDVRADLLGSQTGTDAKVSVKTEFCNGYQCATFSCSDYSIITACCRCMLEAIEYFLNSESAFKKMKLIIEDAKGRNRADIVSKYEYKLASLVNSNIGRYEDV